MAKQTLLGLCLVAVLATRTAAQASTSTLPVVTLLLDPIEGAVFEASVVTVRPEGTLYSIECRTTATVPEPTNQCSWIQNMSILQGSREFTADWTVINGPDSKTTIANYFDCILDGDNGYCTNTVSENGVVTTFPSIFTSIWERTSPITITAGAEKLSGPAVPSVPASTTSSSPTWASNTTQQTPPVSSAVVTGGGTVLRPADQIAFAVLVAGLGGVVLGGVVV
ncbi:hypothetical protein C8A01DRAFT_39976 [Parachaetomium inaequale]|uniref:Ig-like domain-containing protein n=1 Tax=Parachaetomium inaequale TaxID=2588326 RepID=A0AAN6SNF1_9PEZI|nr:hypothetical protein C8A01DRAFT_39976 [Parachaetomium inaequale]